MEQRANINFRFKTGKTATETFQLIKQAYGDNALSLSRTRVFEWYARFWGGRENLKDDESSGPPTVVRTPDMIETVRELISTDRPELNNPPYSPDLSPPDLSYFAKSNPR
jgi:hypothetical protein